MVVVGKVSNGRMTTVIASGNRMVGQVRSISPLPRPVVTLAPAPVRNDVHVYEPIDSPFIKIAQDNCIRLREEAHARTAHLAIENRRNIRLHRIKALFRL